MAVNAVTTDYVSPAPRIAVDHAGEGELVLFLHGVGGNRTLWHDQLRAFAPHFHAAAWDARGYGESDDYDGSLEISDLAGDINRVLDHFGAQKAHIVGLSMGGLIATMYYALHPDRVSTLTLCGTGKGAELDKTIREHLIQTRVVPLQQGQSVADIAPNCARLLMTEEGSERIYEILRESYASLHKESFLKMFEFGLHSGALDYESIAVPTSVLVGDEDKQTPVAACQEASQKIRDSKFSVIPKAGHISNLDQPKIFNDTVLGFLLQHRA